MRLRLSGAALAHLTRNDNGEAMICDLPPSPLVVASDTELGHYCRTATLVISTTSRYKDYTTIVRTNFHIEVPVAVCPSLRLTFTQRW